MRYTVNMELRLNLNLDNDAFAFDTGSAGEEIVGIFKSQVIPQVEATQRNGVSAGGPYALRDSNGNTIGTWEIIG